jgi:hypothetical protein
VRLNGHCGDLRHDIIKRSALVNHSNNTSHQICIDNTKIIAKEVNHVKMKIRDTLEIKLHPNNINRDDIAKLSDV